MSARRSRKPKHEPEVTAARKAAKKHVGSRSGVKSVPSPGKIGRPTIYSEKLVARICAELACGKSLRTVCKADDMPSVEAVFSWIHSKPEFAERYARAKAESADAIIEEVIDIADDGTNDWMEQFDKDGVSIGWKLNGEHVQRSRLRVDTRKWIAAKMRPKKFGEKVDVEHGATDALSALIQSVQGNSFNPVAINRDEDEDNKG
jgi:hypothetical protein